MKTYQDLEAAAVHGDAAIGAFCVDAVNAFIGSAEYRAAKVGDAYYRKHNLTIERYRKFLYKMNGDRAEDIWSANYKLSSLIFRRLVTQQVNYTLGNGLTLSDEKNKEKLGKSFDKQMIKAGKIAMAQGRAYGFWNADHLEIFSFCDTDNAPGFVAIKDVNTSDIRAGIRFWFTNVGNSKVSRYTLYEKDGYTEYRKIDGDPVEVIEPKRGYKANIVRSDAFGEVIDSFENYIDFPIVELFANDCYDSELTGLREKIDCYDFIESDFANDIADLDGLYWVLTNTGGMDDVDLAQFIQRMKTVRAATVDGDQGVNVETHSAEIPTEARKIMLEQLRRDIYEDFQAVDMDKFSAAAKTTQEIQAAFQIQDNKCADFEIMVLDFVDKILELAGIDDTPVYNWNKVINPSEQTNMVLAAANFLTRDSVVKHLPFLTPEEADDIIKELGTEDITRYQPDDETEEE